MAKSSSNKPITLQNIKFMVGSIVYLVTDPEQLPRIVIEIHLKPRGYMYEVRHCTEDSSIHYDIELSETINTDLLNQKLLDKNKDDEEEEEDD